MRPMSQRQIVHIDMDAFYASVEQRDDPNLRGKPVVVAWLGNRSVVCAASYEARKFGIRSAMPAVTAERQCPSAVFIPPNFTKYRAVSHQVHEIFKRYTDLIEPLSLDEAYLDVTGIRDGSMTGVEVAAAIRAEILEETSLTASAGIAPNKFLSKIASDWKKPDGLFEIRPEDIDTFLFPLPLGKLPGVGKVTEEKLGRHNLNSVGDVRALSLPRLEELFGQYGRRLFELARGVDDSPVVPDRPTKSISAEDTFQIDLLLHETRPTVIRLSERVWESAAKETRIAKTVVLKLKTSDFKIITRSFTPGVAISSSEELTQIALSLLDRVELGAETRFRLVGVGVGNLVDPDRVVLQPSLFD